MKSILFITGSYPPDICGVGDYLCKILTSNIAKSNNWRLFYKKDWGYRNFFRYLNEIRLDIDEIVCLQYPTQGYGWSLLPHLLCIYFSIFTKKVFVVCLHEFANSSLKNKLASFLFLLFSNKVIFTSEFERNYALRFFSYKKEKYTVVKICSNISSSKEIASYKNRDVDLLYFGHIRPNKGIEEYINIVSDLKILYPNLKVVLMGQVPLGFSDYYAEIKEMCEKECITIALNRSEIEVCDLLNRTKYSLLPFPDGVSERRGSFLACICNGVNVITKKGKYSTDEIGDVVYYYDGTVTSVKQILELSESYYNIKQSKGISYVKKVIPQSWEHVANSYIQAL